MTYRATTALPYEHLERATAGLRAELRHQVLAAEGAGAQPDWSTLEVTGPVLRPDSRGTVWFEYAATVDLRAHRTRAVVAPPG